MSATFNQGKYVSYFDNVPGCEYIDTISLETMQSVDAFYKSVQVNYLEDVFHKFNASSLTAIRQYLSQFERLMRLDPDAELAGDDGGKSLSSGLLATIRALVAQLHKEEKQCDNEHAKFLIFAPTYRHLEQIHTELTTLMLGDGWMVKVDVLHSSIDMEDCLSSIQEKEQQQQQHQQSHHDQTQTQKYRHILLASAIGDSSITIPSVTCVIDTCRALEVKWDNSKESHNAKTVWASKSICDQRRGRTGRTCPGRVFRLVNKSFYISRLENWDLPQITLASCRDEMLTLLSSSSSSMTNTNNKVFSNPIALLKRCLDPPPELSVQKAIQFLVNMGACEIKKVGSNNNSKERLVPTDLGRLLAGLPYKVSDANMIVRGAKNGMLHEALVLVSILNTRPYPIVHLFGESEANGRIQQLFYEDVNPKDPKSVAIANFAAYLFWYIHWKVNIRQRHGKSRFLHCTNSISEIETENIDYLHDPYNSYPPTIETDQADAYDCNVWEWNSTVADAHSRWCKKHYINPTSVRAVDADVTIALKTLYHKDHEPEWLRCQSSTPKWSKQSESDLPVSYDNIFRKVYGYDKADEICEMLSQLQGPSISSTSLLPQQQCQVVQHKEKMACIHFLNGNCRFGDRCKLAHSYTAPRPLCRFFFNGGCTNASCQFSHENRTTVNSNDEEKSPVHSFYEGGSLSWFQNNAENLLLFGEADFSFTMALSCLGIYPAHATTDSKLEPGTLADRYCTLSNVDATRCHINTQLKSRSFQITKCAWNFPFMGVEEDDSIHTSLLSGTFLSVAAYLTENNYSKNKEFALTLQGDQFSRWSVLECAQRAGFSLDWWEEFDSFQYPGYLPKRGNGERFPAQNARFYVFRLAI
mmetsp:Transcript_24806/g.37057  ORF Transcript_24806/g.37057 Transcript_24806/m.37057 type:complete len:867 (+) Transcript_24806:636-3236(+)